MSALTNADVRRTFRLIATELEAAPFSLVIQNIIIQCVRRISEIERARGDISRADRSTLASEAQPYQELIDRLVYTMADLKEDEIVGLQERLEEML